MLAPKVMSKAKLKEVAATNEKSKATSDKSADKVGKKSGQKQAHSTSKRRKRAAQ
jgi:hypothetical protein